MDPLSVGVAVVAAALGLWRAIYLYRRHIDHALFARIILQLIEQGNVERAVKICRAAPHAVLVAMTTAAIEATAAVDSELGRGYVAQTITDAATAEHAVKAAALARWSWSAPSSIALGIAAIALALRDSTGGLELAILPAGLAITCGVYGTLIQRRILTQAVDTIDDIIQALTDYVMNATGDRSRLRAATGGPQRAADAISRHLGLRPIRDPDARTIPAGGTTIAPTRTQVAPDARAATTTTFDMRKGRCGMCAHDEIATIVRSPLKAYVCKSCGFAQWFADDPSTLDV